MNQINDLPPVSEGQTPNLGLPILAESDPVSHEVFNMIFNTIDAKFNTFNTYSAENILDNWYFAHPVNQRGSTSYTTNGYTVDRWLNETENGSVSVNDEFITFTWNRTTESGHAALIQFIESNRLFVGRTYTFSILASGEGSLQIRGSDANGFYTMELSDTPTLYQYTISSLILDSAGLGRFRIIADTDQNLNGYINIYAAKLELGPVQTLAHKEGDAWVLNGSPPDYTAELLKCQRYYVKIKQGTWNAIPSEYHSTASDTFSSRTHFYITIPLAVPMRARPSLVAKLRTSSLNTTCPEEILVNDLTYNETSVTIGVEISFTDTAPENVKSTIPSRISCDPNNANQYIELDANL